MITLEVVVIAAVVAILGLTAVFGLLLLAPAATVIEIDTATGLARARLRPLWGLAPKIEFARQPASASAKSGIGKIIQRVRDLPRLARALLVTPKLIRPIRRLLSDLDALNPPTKRIIISAPPIHPVATLVLEVLNELPEHVRRGIEVRTKDGLSVEFASRIDVDVAPLTLLRIYRRFRGDDGVREFFRRLSKQPKEAR